MVATADRRQDPPPQARRTAGPPHPIMTPRLFALALGVALVVLPAAGRPEVWLLRGDLVYTSPEQPPISDGVVVVRGSHIVDVGPRDRVPVPPDAPVHRCSGPVVTAGFHNSHVHLLGRDWEDAQAQPAAQLAAQLHARFTRYGYSTIVDLASDGDNTGALQRRIAAGEVAGPRLLTLGWPIFPHRGLPAYLDHLAPDLRARMPQPAALADAEAVVRVNLDAGAVGTKLFLVTPQRDRMTRMPPDIARAAAEATHRRGGVVVAHPTDLDGVRSALDAGVDLLAHTTHGLTTRWPETLLQQAVQRRLSMTPTLMLMGYELAREGAVGPIVNQLIEASVQHVRDFVAAGGDILFGTDAGYMTDFDPTGEYLLLARAGLTPMQILASLTTRPAAKWKDSQRGRLAPGMAADIVVLDADPALNPAHFSRVRCTIGAGRVLHPSDAR